MGLLKYKIRNDFIGESTVLDGLTGSTSGVTSSIVDRSTLNQYKFIPLNIPLDFKPMDRGELIPNFVVSEREKAINKVYDAEKTKWFFWPDYISGMTINFRFFNGITFTSDYQSNGFDITDFYPIIKNGFKKSFYRLYFYDSNMLENRNLIFTEDINVGDPFNLTIGVVPDTTIKIKRLYWLKNDEDFDPLSGSTTNNPIYLNYKTFYVEARFFNAKTGKVVKFINLPTTQTSPITIKYLADNPEYRTSPIKFINPKTNMLSGVPPTYAIGNYNFIINSGVGANTINSITFTEDVKT